VNKIYVITCEQGLYDDAFTTIIVACASKEKVEKLIIDLKEIIKIKEIYKQYHQYCFDKYFDNRSEDWQDWSNAWYFERMPEHLKYCFQYAKSIWYEEPFFYLKEIEVYE
jgi:hypothetical protein